MDGVSAQTWVVGLNSVAAVQAGSVSSRSHSIAYAPAPLRSFEQHSHATSILLCPDFIGVSGYAPLIRPLSDEAMEISWETAGYEFDLFNISLKDLASKGKKLVYRWGQGVVQASGWMQGWLRAEALQGGVGWGAMQWAFRSTDTQAARPALSPYLFDSPSEHGLGGCSWDYSVAPDLDFVKNHPWLGYWPERGACGRRAAWERGRCLGRAPHRQMGRPLLSRPGLLTRVTRAKTAPWAPAFPGSAPLTSPLAPTLLPFPSHLGWSSSTDPWIKPDFRKFRHDYYQTVIGGVSSAPQLSSACRPAGWQPCPA
jgi:hypothetical protein